MMVTVDAVMRAAMERAASLPQLPYLISAVDKSCHIRDLDMEMKTRYSLFLTSQDND